MMPLRSLDAIQQDDLALAVAKALAVANDAATSEGIETSQSLVTISEESSPPARAWRIHYGPRNFQNQRGGDLIVIVDENAGAVQRIIHGQ